MGFHLFTTRQKQILKGTTVIEQVYEKHKDPDGWLYLRYDSSEVF